MNARKHLGELIQEIKNISNEQVRTEFESFIQTDLSPAKARRAVVYTEKLSDRFDSVERKEIKLEFKDLFRYGVPPDEAKRAIIAKYSEGATTEKSSDAVSDQSTETTSGYDMNTYERIKELFELESLETVPRERIESEFKTLAQTKFSPTEAQKAVVAIELYSKNIESEFEIINYSSSRRELRELLMGAFNPDVISDQYNEATSSSDSDYRLQMKKEYPENGMTYGNRRINETTTIAKTVVSAEVPTVIPNCMRITLFPYLLVGTIH